MQILGTSLAAFLIVLHVQAEEECALYSLYENKCEDDTMYHTTALKLWKTYSSSTSVRGIPVTIDAVYTCDDGKVQAEYQMHMTSGYPSFETQTVTETEHFDSSCEEQANWIDQAGEWKKYHKWHCGPCCVGDDPESCGHQFHTRYMEWVYGEGQELMLAFAESEGIQNAAELTRDFRQRFLNFCSQSSSRKRECCALISTLVMSEFDDGCGASNPHNPHSDPMQSFEELCPAVADEYHAKISKTESVATCRLGDNKTAMIVGIILGSIVLVISVRALLLWHEARKKYSTSTFPAESSSAPATPMKDEEAQLESQPTLLGNADPAAAEVKSCEPNAGL